MSLADSLGMEKTMVKKRTLNALILPGSGQIASKQYWKLPVFYGGIGALAYMAREEHLKFKDYDARRADYLYQPPYTSEYLAKQDGYIELRDKTDTYKKNRNFYYMGIYLVYALSIVDAVDQVPVTRHSPAKATFYSTFIPGLGQIYNRKYWKVPIIYGGYYFIFEWLVYYRDNYGLYKQGYIDLSNENFDSEALKEIEIDTSDPEKALEKLEQGKDFYRRNMELQYILAGALYVLNIVDAAVDAHFYKFNVTEDLSLKWEPAMWRMPENHASAGIRFTLTF